MALKYLEQHIAFPGKIHDDGVPSVSIGVLDEDGCLASHVITSSNGKENENTIYQACSISKAITALAVAKLVDQAKLSYADKIIDYIPRTALSSLAQSESYLEQVTVESLVSHRSGLSQHGFPGYAGDEVPTLQDIIDGRPPANTPRFRFNSFPFAQLSYSGGGYVILQIYLEHVLHLPFSAIMQQTVLQPLQMTRSRYDDLPSGEDNYARAYATDSQIATSNKRGYYLIPESAAAGLWTTPADLLKAIAAIQYSLHHDDGFLSRATATRMLTLVTPNQPHLNMALGWGADDTVFGHRGDNYPGYNTYVFGAHDGAVNAGATSAKANSSENETSSLRRGAFAILTNSVLGFETIQKIVAAVFYLNKWPLLPRLPGNFGTLTSFVPYAAPEGTLFPDEVIDAWVGKWKHGWTINKDGEGGLKVNFPGAKTPVRLRVAAIPLGKYFEEDGQAGGESSTEEEFMSMAVVDGLEVAFGLIVPKASGPTSWAEKARLRVVQTDTIQVLKRLAD